MDFETPPTNRSSSPLLPAFAATPPRTQTVTPTPFRPKTPLYPLQSIAGPAASSSISTNSRSVNYQHHPQVASTLQSCNLDQSKSIMQPLHVASAVVESRAAIPPSSRFADPSKSLAAQDPNSGKNQIFHPSSTVISLPQQYPTISTSSLQGSACPPCDFLSHFLRTQTLISTARQYHTPILQDGTPNDVIGSIVPFPVPVQQHPMIHPGSHLPPTPQVFSHHVSSGANPLPMYYPPFVTPSFPLANVNPFLTQVSHPFSNLTPSKYNTSILSELISNASEEASALNSTSNPNSTHGSILKSNAPKLTESIKSTTKDSVSCTLPEARRMAYKKRDIADAEDPDLPKCGGRRKRKLSECITETAGSPVNCSVHPIRALIIYWK